MASTSPIPQSVILGLDPRMFHFKTLVMAGYTYILTNITRGQLYVGVTNDLVRRVYEHREGLADGHTKAHGIKRLVHFDVHETMPLAIQREKSLKRWYRSWKIALIEENNPEWRDLWEEIVK